MSEIICYDLAEDNSLKRLECIKVDFMPQHGDFIRMQLWDNWTKSFYSYIGEVQRIFFDINHERVAKTKIFLRKVENKHDLSVC